MRGHFTEVRQVLDSGGTVDERDSAGRTPLFSAIQSGDLGIVTELIDRGASVNAKDSGLKTPLHFAASEYKPQLVDLLMRSGAEVDAQDSDGNSPLSDAVFYSKGRGDVIWLLFNRGADKRLKNRHGVSPLDLANSIGNYDVDRK